MKRSIVIDGWTVQLRVRTQRKKRKVNGRTRGRYEAKSAYVTVRAPNGDKRTWYVGSGDRLVRQVLDFGTRGKKISSSPATSSGGRKQGRKPAVMDADTRDPADDRTLSMFPSRREPTCGVPHAEWRAKRKQR